MVDGKEVTMQVTVGQKVIYSKYAGTEVKLDGEEYIIVKQNDILAVVKINLRIEANPVRYISGHSCLHFGIKYQIYI